MTGFTASGCRRADTGRGQENVGESPGSNLLCLRPLFKHSGRGGRADLFGKIYTGCNVENAILGYTETP